MIDTQTAQELVILHSSTISKTKDVDLKDAMDYVLTDDVVSKIDMPPFRQSAMDGYAINSHDRSVYKIVDEIKAGDSHSPIIKIGEAVRIFTGGPVPDMADAVIMQEHVIQDENQIIVEKSIIAQMNIRPKGEQIERGAIALTKGTIIKGAHIGFLASLGVKRVTVREKPSIAIIVTGDELKTPEKELLYGEVYESNGAMLTAVLNELGYKNNSVITVKDSFESTKNILEESIRKCDIVITTGGVSVGDYDFVRKALDNIGVKEIFYKIKQKPGKPLFFGKKDTVSLFGLPGNPAAALSCFYLYVYPLLKKSEGAKTNKLPRVLLPLLTHYSVKGDRAQYLKARIENEGVQILDGQSSAMVRAFGDANALVFLPENTRSIRKGEKVNTILLPFK